MTVMEKGNKKLTLRSQPYITMNLLYSIFIETIRKSLKNPEIILSAKDTKNLAFYTSKGDPKSWNSVFNYFIKNIYADEASNFLKEIKTTNIEDTVSYYIYNDDNLNFIDVSYFNNEKDDVVIGKIVTPLKGKNGILYRDLKAVFSNWNTVLDEEDILTLWTEFKHAFYGVSKSVSLFDNNNHFNKDYAYYAINDGYIKVSKTDFEILPLETTENHPLTILKLNINKDDVTTLKKLNSTMDKANYSIFKSAVESKVKNFDTLAMVFADILQPQMNTEILTFLIGSQGSGKSTFQNVFKHYINSGNELVGSVSLLSAINNPFEREVLFQKPIVFSSELDSSTLKDQGILKQLISRELQQINLKYRAVKAAKPIAKILVASNGIINTPNADGINRRFCFVQFQSKQIREDLTIEQFNKELSKDVKGFVAFVIHGAQLLLNKGWNYLTFKNSSDAEITKQFEGNYSAPQAFTSSLFENEILLNRNDCFVSFSEIFGILRVLSISALNTEKYGEDFYNQIDGFKNEINGKKSTKSLIKKIYDTGLESISQSFNRDFWSKENKEIEAYKINLERTYKSNLKKSYRWTTILKNVAFNYDKNSEWIDFLKKSTVTLDALEKIGVVGLEDMLSDDIKMDENGNEKDWKKRSISLYWLFVKEAPDAEFNKNRCLDCPSNIKTIGTATSGFCPWK